MSNFDSRVEEFIERTIYVLECEDGYCYVGESKDKWLDMRIKQQFGERIKKGGPSNFCQRHKPIKVLATYNLGKLTYKNAEIIENAWTKVYANMFGKDKVMGGIACLDDEQKKEISSDTKKEILGNCSINGLD